jgi:cell division protein FtsB
MRWLLIIISVLFLALQYRIWFGEGSFAQKIELERVLENRKQANLVAEQRNDLVAREVKGLKNGTDSMEERARSDLGMIKEGETFYMVLDKETDPR